MPAYRRKLPPEGQHFDRESSPEDGEWISLQATKIVNLLHSDSLNRPRPKLTQQKHWFFLLGTMT